MKVLKILSVILFIAVFAACVPSLHGIVKVDEEVINDRIIGQWIGNRLSGNTQVKITVDDDQGEKKEFSSIKDMVSYFGGDSTPASGSTWLIERVGNITYEKIDEESTSSVTLDMASASMAPKGYEITRFDSLPFYILTHIDWDKTDTIISYLTIKLTEIGIHKYMDFAPFPKGIDFWEGRFGTNLIAGHTFARYEVNEQGLVIQPIDGDHIDDLISQKRVRLKHEKVDGSTILTASTDELRAFLEKYQSDPELYDDEELLVSVAD